MDINAASLIAGLTAAPAPTTPVAPDALATARFEQVMNTPPGPGLDPAATGTASPLPAAENRTLGDNILAGMQNLSTDFQQSWKAVSQALEAGQDMTTADMLKLQLGLTQMSVQYDLVGKAISRSTQNLDQLVKLQ